MKKILFILAIAPIIACAQPAKNYTFKDVSRVVATDIKSQDRTGTCWAFSTASFLESEALRLGRSNQNLSEMYVVRHVYRKKCENYVRRQGDTRFSEGGLAHDLLDAVRDYGLVPEQVYPGRKDIKQPFDHSGLEKKLKSICDELVEQGKEGTLPADWISQIEQALDAEFGPLPAKFAAEGFTMTPESYRDMLGIKTTDYVNLTSFTHHPFWTSFILEVPDNFAHGAFYNMPIDDLMRTLNYALQRGYGVEWDADVSNSGFSAANGLALVPQQDMSAKNEAARAQVFKQVEPEKFISQEYRQELFDRQVTQDDHLMHITGLLEGPDAKPFYAVKNSWGAGQGFKGYVHASEAYLRLNTISITLHKDALPSDIRKRMGLESGEEAIIRQNQPGTKPDGPRMKVMMPDNAAQPTKVGKLKANDKVLEQQMAPPDNLIKQ
jgi:bleomycin hydrolase